MAFNRNDRVVNIRTGEFGSFESVQEVVTAGGQRYMIYCIQPDREGAPRQGWREEEIAPWAKAAKATGITPQQ